MKKSGKAKASKREDGVDFISNLPDHVLRLILSRLEGTEEVIRTSILSTRWRYLWTSVPSIDINCTRLPLRLDSIGLKDFVCWVLLNKPQPLDSFRLLCANFYNMLTIRQWIHAAVMRKVKLLDLTFWPKDVSEDIQLPHSLVTCGSLEVLKLWLLGYQLCVPNITGFQALRVLELREVDLLGDNLVKYFLESCPLLEDLSLIDCPARELVISSPKLKNLTIDTRQLVTQEEQEDNDLDWGMCFELEISCPKLVFLKLRGYVAYELLFENLYSLKKVVMHPKDLFVLWEVPTLDLFAEISHVESLSISLYCVGQCFDPRVDAPISLPHLKTLELTVDCINVDVLIPFLICLPDLESLHLIITKNFSGLDMWNLEGVETLSIVTRHLKKVEFIEFDEEKSRLAVARALLEHGNALEEMVFSWGIKARFHERSTETMNEALKFHKASSTVKLRCSLNL